jgi:SAM-dependent MidA family methyltransferase
MSTEPPRDSPEAPAAPGSALSGRLRNDIRRSGPMRFSRFLERALYAPGEGYYAGGGPGIGASGDFVTAPEISPVFASCLARGIAPALQVPGAAVLELGAGNGTLAKDLLMALERLGCLPESYRILEVSGALRNRQETLIGALPARVASRVTWLDSLPESPLDGVILANEVADALVFEAFAVTAEGPRYRGVADGPGGLCWTELPADAELLRFVAAAAEARGEALPPVYVSEFRPLLAPWVASLAACLQTGAMIVVDYGLPRRELYSDDRRAGTLCCFSGQRAHPDPFRAPGREDITAWVDFTAIAEAFHEAGLLLEGFTTQAAYLIENGYTDAVAEIADTASLEDRLSALAAARRLVMPGEMGERFRVIAASRNLRTALPGFSGLDLTRTL